MKKNPTCLLAFLRLRTSLLFFLSCFLFQTYAQDFTFRHLDVDDGLPDHRVNQLFQDSQGFIWIGTYNGLARYDGYEFTVFKPSEEDPHSIRGREVWAIREGKDGQLWIGTESGLNRFDPGTERFYFYAPSKKGGFEATLNYVFFIREDQRGGLWIIAGEDALISGGLLVRFDPAAESFSAMTHDSADVNSIGFDRVFCHLTSATTKFEFPLIEDLQGRIWIGSNGKGLDCYDPKTESFKHYRHQPNQPNTPSSDTIYALFLDREGILWMGASDGLNRYNPESDDFTVFYHQEESNEPAGTRGILSIKEDSDGYLWLSSPLSLERFDKKTELFRFR